MLPAAALLALALAALPASAAFKPSLRLNLTLSAADRVVAFLPATAGGDPAALEPAWNVTYRGASAPPSAGGSGSGQAQRTTRAGVAASAHLKFVGTAVRFYGRADPAAWDKNRANASPPSVFVDVQQTNVSLPAGDVLWGIDDLPWGYHDVQLAIDGNWTVDEVVVTYAVQTQAPHLADMTVRTEPMVLDGAANPFYTAEGEWKVTGSIGASGDETPYPHLLGTNTSTLAFAVPANTSLLLLNGTTGPDKGVYVVALTPPPPLAEASVNVDAQSKWTDPVLLYLAALDPAVQYTVALSSSVLGGWTEVEGRQGYHSATFYSGLSDIKEPAPMSHTPAIVGGVIGGLALLAGIAALAFRLGRRKRSKGDKRAKDEWDGVTPYEFDMRRATLSPVEPDAVPLPDTLSTPGYGDGDDEPAPHASTAYLVAKGETLAALSARG
ncbi:hypothetical protein Q8F55_001273 [Vanrija albida]|uniref:Fibronectin type-III domain-containing protein n=1 Tax=Vanrija albida TaxID=181172 RepID=A0ABR3QFM7_9TREE